ncbi:MAG: hypothetical protein PWQ69_276 [Methanomicrobiaceae archaeon]|nr:hypothetical protein [Methanomicrobiaceae archaeon]
MMIAPDIVLWAGAGSLGGCQVRPRRDCQIPGDCIHGESPRGGEGLAGEGGGGDGSPLFQRVTGNGIRRPPPPPGRSAASSRPLERGRAVCGDSPDSRARGEGEDFGVGDRIEPRICSSWPWHCIDGIPPPRGGWNIPSPVSCVSLKTPPPGTPPPLQSLRNGVSQKGARRCRHPESVHGGGSLNPGCGREPGKPLLKKDQ